MPKPTLDELLAILQRPVETDEVDFKDKLDQTAKAKAEFVKDVAAMSNSPDGGILVFGVRGTTLVGVPAIELAKYDPANLHNLIKDKLSPTPTITSEKITHAGLDFMFVFITPPEDAIVIVSKDAADDTRVIVHAGMVMQRKNTQSIPISNETELRRLFDKIITDKVKQATGIQNAIQEQLAAVASNLSKAVPVLPTAAPASPLREQVETIGQTDIKITTTTPRWHIGFTPTSALTFTPSQIASAYGVTLEYGGDNFPMLGIFHNFCTVSRSTNGFIAKSLITENWREISGFGLNGAFIYRASLIEDFLLNDRGAKYFENAISVEATIRKFALTLRYLFSVAEKLEYHGEWTVTFSLKCSAGRKLHSGLGVGFITPKHTVDNDITIQKTVALTDKPNVQSIVSEMCSTFFNHFNWETARSQSVTLQEADAVINRAAVRNAAIWFVV